MCTPVLQAPSVELPIANASQLSQRIVSRSGDQSHQSVNCRRDVLYVDTAPDYTDTANTPPTGQSALWKYEPIYRQGDDRAGQCREVGSLPVAG